MPGDFREGVYYGGRSYEDREEVARWAREGRWRWWVTLTFRRPRRDYIAAQVTIERELAKLPAMLQPTLVLCALEAHASGCLHAHALWSATPGRQACMGYAWWNEWWYKRQGIARFYPYDPGKGAAWYITKYLLKGEHVDSHWFVWSAHKEDLLWERKTSA